MLTHCLHRWLTVLSLLCLLGGVNKASAQVASIGNTKYATLQEAFEAASTTSTIKILENIDNFGKISFTGKTLTLNLDGHTVSGTSITVGKNASFTISSKSSYASVDDNYNVTYNSSKTGKLSLTGSVTAVDGGQVTMNNGMVESKDVAFFAVGDETGQTPVASKVTITGGYVKAQEGCALPLGNGANVTINGGKYGVVLECLDNAAVAGNGTYDVAKNKKLGGTTISISGNNQAYPCVLLGRIQSKGYVACGVYHPQQGTLTIGNYTKIVALGGAGIVMRGGELNLGDTKSKNIEIIACLLYTSDAADE